MLVPLTRRKFEQIIPIIATGSQYAHYWGSWQKLLQRLLISLVAVISIWLVGKVLGHQSFPIVLILGVSAGFYWLWGPVYWASMRNASYRKYPYSGFWRGRVLDAYITEDIVKESETFNQRGELVILENRERRINVVVGDQSGFEITVQAPLTRIHKVIKPGLVAELLILSKEQDLATIARVSDIYIPSHNIWVGEYPYLERDIFAQVSADLGGSRPQSPRDQLRNNSNVPRRKRYNN